jgi:hypothetical protein
VKNSSKGLFDFQTTSLILKNIDITFDNFRYNSLFNIAIMANLAKASDAKLKGLPCPAKGQAACQLPNDWVIYNQNPSDRFTWRGFSFVKNISK